MLGHRLRRWPNIKPTPGQRALFARRSSIQCPKALHDPPTLAQRLGDVSDAGPALIQRWAAPVEPHRRYALITYFTYYVFTSFVV